MLSHLLMAAVFGTRVIRMITLMYSCLLDVPTRHPARHIADETIWDINSTCAEFGSKCLHFLWIQYLTVSDTTSYLYGKDNISALKILIAGDFPGLSTVFGEPRVNRSWN